MIDQIRVEAIRRRLSESPQNLYAVLDGASVPDLAARLSEHQVNHLCLLPGELAPELARVAPYLAEIQVQSPFFALLSTSGLGPHWGIIAASDADLRSLRMHFRACLSVWDPDGKPLYFRFYDPRVLRVYLPTCNTEELQLLFGPVTAFYAESVEPDTLLCLTFDGARLGRHPLIPSATSAAE